MTIEPAAPAGTYTVMGTGPYAINWPYSAGAVRVAVVLAGVRTELVPGTDFTVSPLAASISGDLTLSAGAAATYATGTIYLSRDTLVEQGWVGTLGEREKGLETQMDLLTMKAQEQEQGRDSTLRFDTPVPPMVAIPGSVILFDDLGQPIAGPIASDIADAQANAAVATAAAAAAELAEDGAATSAAAAALSAIAAAQSAADAALYATIGGSEQSYLINADFRIWERNTPLALNGLWAANGYGGPDQWINGMSGGAVQMTRPVFNPGQQLGVADPRVYLQQQVSGQAAAGDYAYVSQRITPVDRYQGRQITITGWALLPDGAGNIAVSALQNFGTGGSPSASVTIPGVTVAIAAGGWQKFKATLNIPSLAGKVRGNQDDDFVEFFFWSSAGANKATESNNLGIQNRRVALWGLEVHLGDVPASAADNFKLVYPGRTLLECQRYFQLGDSRFQGQTTSGVYSSVPVYFATPMRKVPILSQAATATVATNFVGQPLGNILLSKSGFFDRRQAIATGAGLFEHTWQADAQL